MVSENQMNEVHIESVPPGPKSQEIFAKSLNLMGSSNICYLYGISLYLGKNCYVRDVDENIYLDAFGAASANILGYNVGGVAEAYFAASKKNQHTAFAYTPNLPALELAEKLIAVSPIQSPQRVMLGLSGSDASEGAIMVMRKATGKMGVIHFENAYHGSTGLSQLASDFRNLNQGIFAPDPYFFSLEYPTTPEKAEVVLYMVDKLLKSGLYGGMIIETIQGDGGLVMPDPKVWSELNAVLKTYDGLLIIDEVQSGMGRTGTWWAFEQYDVTPDIFVSGKGLSAGYAPISAIIGKEEYMNSLTAAQEVFTYAGHAPSAAAASTTISYIQDQNLLENVKRQGSKLIDMLTDVQSRYPTVISDVRGKGLMIGVEIDCESNLKNAAIFATRCAELGVYFGLFGASKNVMRVEPPLIIEDREVEKIVEVISTVADQMFKKEIPQATYENVEKYCLWF